MSLGVGAAAAISPSSRSECGKLCRGSNSSLKMERRDRVLERVGRCGEEGDINPGVLNASKSWQGKGVEGMRNCRNSKETQTFNATRSSEQTQQEIRWQAFSLSRTGWRRCPMAHTTVRGKHQPQWRPAMHSCPTHVAPRARSPSPGTSFHFGIGHHATAADWSGPWSDVGQ